MQVIRFFQLRGRSGRSVRWLRQAYQRHRAEIAALQAVQPEPGGADEPPPVPEPAGPGAAAPG